MRGPSGAFLLSAIQMLAGTFALLFLTLLRWRMVSRGYFRSTAWVLWPLAALLALALPEQHRAPALGVAALWLLFKIAVYSQRPLVEWVTGAAGAAGGIALVLDASAGACPGVCGPMVGVAGAALLGSVTHGMTLGHWYLNQARLPIGPLAEAARIMLIGIAVAAATGIALRSRLLAGTVSSGILPITTESYWWAWGLLLLGTALLWFMIRSTVKIGSNQSATGLLYVAITTALGAQFVLDLLAAT